MFEKWRNLDGDNVDFVIYYAIGHDANARKFYSNCWKKKSNHDLCLLWVHCDENRERGSLIEDGWKPEMYFFITVVLLGDHMITSGHQFSRRAKWKTSKRVFINLLGLLIKKVGI